MKTSVVLVALAVLAVALVVLGRGGGCGPEPFCLYRGYNVPIKDNMNKNARGQDVYWCCPKWDTPPAGWETATPKQRRKWCMMPNRICPGNRMAWDPKKRKCCLTLNPEDAGTCVAPMPVPSYDEMRNCRSDAEYRSLLAGTASQYGIEEGLFERNFAKNSHPTINDRVLPATCSPSLLMA